MKLGEYKVSQNYWVAYDHDWKGNPTNEYWSTVPQEDSDKPEQGFRVYDVLAVYEVDGFQPRVFFQQEYIYPDGESHKSARLNVLALSTFKKRVAKKQ